MDEILIYSDSLTWGIIPNTRKRLPYDKRWPGIFEGALKELGINVRVIENCLNGRRTAWSDPFKSGRDGSEHLAQTIEMHSPLKLVIILLGSNDFQCTHNELMGSEPFNSWSSPGPWPGVDPKPGYEHDLAANPDYLTSCTSATNLPDSYDDCPTAGVSEFGSQWVFSFGSFDAKKSKVTFGTGEAGV